MRVESWEKRAIVVKRVGTREILDILRKGPDILSRLVNAGRGFSYDMAVSFITDAEDCLQGD